MANKEKACRLVLGCALAATLLGISAQGAYASEASGGDGGTKAPSARHYLDEMAVMDAQISYMQKEMELRNMLSQRAQRGALPKVVSIVKDGKGAWALVGGEGEVTRWVKAGDVLTGGLRVKRVLRSSVMVAHGDEEFALRFVGANEGQGQDMAQQTGPLPPPPAIAIPDLPDLTD